jgi:hypothetical protein
MHNSVYQDLPLQILDELVYFNIEAPIFLPNAQWLHRWADHAPLARPVFPDPAVSVNNAAFHAVGPHDVVTHQRESCVHIASIECGVRLLQEPSCVLVHERVSTCVNAVDAR